MAIDIPCSDGFGGISCQRDSLRVRLEAAEQRAQRAEGDADRLARRVAGIPGQWVFEADAEALRLHDEAVAQRDTDEEGGT